MDLWGPWLQIKLGANAVQDLLTACVNQTIINLPQIRNRRIRVLQDILDGGHCVMRAAGCVINDFADRDIDPHVRRTRDRPLAARRVSPLEALALFGVLIAIAVYLVTLLDPLTIKLAVIGGALTVSYPFVKRVFPLPQLYLGISFGGWSVPMAFAAQSGQLPRVAWTLYIAAAIWAAAYDTMYAMVDREDDLKIGVKSSAILFADLDRLLIGVMQIMTLLALVLVGHSLHFGRWYEGGLAAAGLLFAYQQWLIRKREPAGCLRAFATQAAARPHARLGDPVAHGIRRGHARHRSLR